MNRRYSNKYEQLIHILIQQRKQYGITQDQLAKYLNLDQSSVSRYEAKELILDLETLSEWCDRINITLNEALERSEYISTPKFENASKYSLALPSHVEETCSGFCYVLKYMDTKYPIYFDNCSIEAIAELELFINNRIQLASENKIKNRDAIAQMMLQAFSALPAANPSDVYHHIIYRNYIQKYDTTDPNQSWARASGEAMEIFIAEHYKPILSRYGIDIRLAFQQETKNVFLEDMGIAEFVPGKSKLDIGLYGNINGKFVPFGGIHSKASLAERVSDDKPCSEIMMQNGFKSYLYTFDAKSFPPPNGDLVNRGELGSVDRPSDKRAYIENYGSFDACFSYNLRTNPSVGNTPSGKKIYTCRLSGFDHFVEKVVQDWEEWKVLQL